MCFSRERKLYTLTVESLIWISNAEYVCPPIAATTHVIQKRQPLSALSYIKVHFNILYRMKHLLPFGFHVCIYRNTWNNLEYIMEYLNL